MLTVTKPADDRVDIELTGPLDGGMMGAGLDTLIEASRDVAHGRMLYRIVDFEMPTMGALMVEATRLPGLFSLIGKFDRCAVLADAAWLRTAAEIEGRLIPGLEIRSFELEEAEAAEAWLGEGVG